MSIGIRTYPKHEQDKVIGRRLANGHRDDQRGLGYWAARDASSALFRRIGTTK